MTSGLGQYSKKVAITGVGLICALGETVQESWTNLIAGRSGIRSASVFNTAGQRSNLAAELQGDYPVKPGPRAENLIRNAVEQAIGCARISSTALARGGLCLGTSLGGWGWIEDLLLKAPPSQHQNPEEDRFPYFAPTALLAQEFGLMGPTLTVSNACAAGATAIGVAMEVIRQGQAEVMIAGGYDVLTAMTYSGFHAIRAASTKGIRPFDRARDGLILGEGAGVLILESIEHASARGASVLAYALGAGTSCDGYSMVRPDPTGAGAAAAITDALKDAGIVAGQVDFISAHGTATPYNDPMETAAFKRVFGDRAHSVPIHSIKSMIGHTLGAAGAIEAVICVQIILTGIIPPTINLETPDPACDLDYVPNQARTCKVDIALSTSSAFAGNNTALVIGACRT